MPNPNPFQILYEDAQFIAINKPEGMLVHRSAISEDRRFVMQALREQIGAPVFTIHRLDRATSGVLIYGKSSESAAALAGLFREKKVTKKYHAIVRGWTDEKGTIDYAIRDQDKPKASLLDSITHYHTLGKSEVAHAIGYKYPTARFSLVDVSPETGRRHQIRKHFAHILHPVIGDKRHGDNKHNNYFWNSLEIPRMLLHASELGFTHPVTGTTLCIQAPVDALFQKALKTVELEGYF